MKIKQSVAAILIVSLNLTACGKSNHEGQNSPPNIPALVEQSTNASLSDDLDKTMSFDSWKKLVLTEDKINFSLAKIFASHVSKADRAEVQKYIEDNLSKKDVRDIVEKVGLAYKTKKNHLLYNDAIWANKSYLLSNSLINQESDSSASSANFESKLLIETAAKVKRKVLNDILSTYTKSVAKTSESLASDLAYELKEKQSLIATKIEQSLKENKRDATLALLKEGLLKLDYFGSILSDATLTDNEVIATALAGAFSLAIYNQIKDDKTFIKVKKIINDIETLKKEIKNASMVIAAIKDLQTKTSDDIQKFSDATNEFDQCSRNLYNTVSKEFQKNPDQKNSDDQINTLKDYLILKTRDEATQANGHYSADIKKMNDGLLKMSSSLTSMASNFDNIITTAEDLFNIAGIHIGSDAKKLIGIARKASIVVNTGAKILSGFVNGGFAGASMAFLGASGSLFGASDPMEDQNQIMEQLQAMDVKLDKIIDLQKRTLELQLNTMKLIRDLAIMVDEYHQKEMQALAGLRDDGLVNMEIAKALQNEEIRKCETLIEYKLYNPEETKNARINRQSLDSDFVNITHKVFYGKLTQYQSFQAMIKSTNISEFDDCKKGISKSFASLNTLENPILAVYNSNEDSNMLAFQRDIYKPLKNVVTKFIGERSTIEIPLHVPMVSINNLENKYNIIENSVKPVNPFSAYYLDNLISPIALTRYASSLLVLYPILDTNSEDWAKDPNAIVDRFFNNLYGQKNMSQDDYHVYLKSNSLDFLKNALTLTQSAIAQEAILAGEPILDIIYKDSARIFSSETPCSDGWSETSRLSCAIYSNRLLLQNFLLYRVKRILDKAGYLNSNATNNEDARTRLINLLNGSDNIFNKKNIFFDQEIGYYLKLNGTKTTIVPLPKEENLVNFNIIYSENMMKLIKLQDKLIDAIIDISPVKGDPFLAKEYSALLLSNAN